MTKDITYLIKRIKGDVINYLTLRNIEYTPNTVEDATNEVISIAGITIGEDKYFHQDVIDAVNNVLE